MAASLDRLPFAWLRERDIDLLLCAELHADAALTRLLAKTAGAPTARFVGAWVSHSEIEGESDLVVEFESNCGRLFALVENKIAAAFQPDQGVRYAARAAKLRADGSTATTVLAAPREYLARPGAEHFEVHLSYEEIAESLSAAGDRRSSFLAQTLRDGVESYRRGYIATPDTAISEMWLACWEVACRVAPELRFERPGLKPGRSTWIYFRDAVGFHRRAPAVVVYKAERGQADLQFARMSAAQLRAAAANWLEADMSVVAAGKSASLRVVVPTVDFRRSGAEQEQELATGLGVCERLRQFFVRHGDSLLSAA